MCQGEGAWEPKEKAGKQRPATTPRAACPPKPGGGACSQPTSGNAKPCDSARSGEDAAHSSGDAPCSAGEAEQAKRDEAEDNAQASPASAHLCSISIALLQQRTLLRCGRTLCLQKTWLYEVYLDGDKLPMYSELGVAEQ